MEATFADLEYDGKKRKTRREIFLERMDGLIPWEQLEERIRPFYPKAGRGRRPYDLAVMLRIHCVQLFYNLSDPGTEDMLYEIESVRRFVGLRLSGPLPDETTILNFRHLLEEHELGEGLFEEINRHLESQGLRLREGTIVDASIIEAPSSTKNRAGKRDPEMHQTKKGNEWRFGMKVHIGADAQTGGELPSKVNEKYKTFSEDVLYKRRTGMSHMSETQSAVSRQTEPRGLPSIYRGRSSRLRMPLAVAVLALALRISFFKRAWTPTLFLFIEELYDSRLLSLIASRIISITTFPGWRTLEEGNCHPVPLYHLAVGSESLVSCRSGDADIREWLQRASLIIWNRKSMNCLRRLVTL